jgi:hypothetical protein
MAPRRTHSAPVHAIVRRQLPRPTFIGIAVAVGVFLIVLITIALLCYIRGWRRLRFGRQLQSNNQSSPRTKGVCSHRASKYWSADDIGRARTVEEVAKGDSKRESHVVVLPIPTIDECRRVSRVVKLPPPSLISWRSDPKEHNLPRRPKSRRVAVLKRHVSMQFKDINVATSPTPDQSPVVDGFLQAGRVTDLDWQEYRH